MNSTNSLRDELETFEKKKRELLANSRGKFVLIKDKQTLGVFETETDAINQGLRKFKNNPFLVKQVLDTEPDYNFLSNLITV